MNTLYNIRPITAAQTIPLRSAVLREGLPVTECIFKGDDDPATVHLGVFVEESIVGVASLYQKPLPAEAVQSAEIQTAIPQETRIWQLRGMAVEPKLQGQGYGSRLLAVCLRCVAEQGGRLVWCNARKNAVNFYRRGGFETCGSEFLIPGVGPHYVMLCFVEAISSSD